jgi:protein-tyrosine phosphatase
LLFFKKNKPLLKDIIPNDYIDIHSHLLPGIDDGAATIEDTISLISQLKAIGVTEFITTPHIINSVWNNTKQSIELKYQETISQLKNESEAITIQSAAAEYMLDSFFFDLIKIEEPLLTLKDNYVLVEMSYLDAPHQLYDMIFELQIAGYIPILAHPERYLFYYNHFEEYHRLKKAGCLFQLNLLSTVGYYGAGVATLAQKLLNNEMYDFVGSDVHHENHIKAFSNKIVMKNYTNLIRVFENNTLFKS